MPGYEEMHSPLAVLSSMQNSLHPENENLALALC